MLFVAFDIKGINKCRCGVEGENIPEYLAEFVNPQKGQIEAKKMNLPGLPTASLVTR